MGMMEYERKLSSYLFNKTRRGLLALLFGRPDESFYVNQIVQLLYSGSGAVQRELKMMTEAGIVVRERKGNLVYYRANSNSPIFSELKNIVRKTFGVAESVNVMTPPEEKLSHRFPVPESTIADFCRKHHIEKLALFGSVLREDFRPDSDIDVLVEFKPGKTPGFLKLVNMEAELSDMFDGRKVELRTPEDLSRYFRDRVIEEAEVQYAAAG